MQNIKVISIFGTRPEAIKMCPLAIELGKRKNITSKVIVTAQHRQMLDQVLGLFDIKPDYDLNIMQPNQTLHELTARVITNLTPILQQEKPDIVLVHGDTTTTLASSLAAFYANTKVGHVEAGLRTDNLYLPYPEEMNRRVTTRLTALHFAPTQTAYDNLIRENVDPATVFITGNTVIDALLATAAKDYTGTIPGFNEAMFADKKMILVTAHRRENFGEPLLNIVSAIKELTQRNKDIAFLIPVHHNPNVKNVIEKELAGNPQVCLIEPLDYEPFVAMMKKSYIILTDSGGVQEEAPSLGKPVLVMRETTERPEAVAAGTVELVGADREKIISSVEKLLRDEVLYKSRTGRINPYGDGQACARIADIISEKITTL